MPRPGRNAPTARYPGENWRLNPHAPLASGLVFAGLGQMPGSTVYRDSSLYRNDGTLTGYTGAGNTPADRWTWDGALKRSILGFNNGSDYGSDYVPLAAKLSVTKITTASGFCLAGWFRPSLLDGLWKGIIDKSNESNRQFFVGINGNYACPVNGLTLFTNQFGRGAVGTKALTVNRWYFFVVWNTGAVSGNFMAVKSVNGPWEDIVAGSNSPTDTYIDIDNLINPVRVGTGNATSFPFSGSIADILYWNTSAAASAATQLWDPSNIDLRVGGVPLILPPARVLYAVGAALPPAYYPAALFCGA